MKVKFYKFIRHTVPILSAFFVFVACFAFPAGASSSTVSYLDLDPNITVDGDNNLIRLYVPSEYWNINLRNANNDILSAVTGGDYLSYWLAEGESYRIDVYLFRNTHFSVKGLPDDTRITIRWNSEQGMALLPPPDFMQETWYFDSSGNEVSWSGSAPVSSSYQGEVSFDWYIKPGSVPNASSMAFGGNFSHGTAVMSGNFNYWIEYVLLEFSISSFLVSQQMTGQNTELLNEVNKQLAEQGKKMDDFINGTPEQNESANSAAGILGDKGEQLGGLANAIQPDKPNLDSVNTNVSDLVPSTGLNSLTSAISPIANNEFVIKILVMVATLVLVSYVLFGKRG